MCYIGMQPVCDGRGQGYCEIVYSNRKSNSFRLCLHIVVVSCFNAVLKCYTVQTGLDHNYYATEAFTLQIIWRVLEQLDMSLGNLPLIYCCNVAFQT